MSGPSATAKPMSAKIAVISSVTWLIGWIRPRTSRRLADRQGHVDRLGGETRRQGGLGQRGLARRDERRGDPVLAGR